MASDKSISTDVTAIEGGKIIFAPDVIATIGQSSLPARWRAWKI